MKVNNYFKEWFSFSRSEKNGIVVLLVLIVIVSLLHLFKGYFRDDTISDFTEFENQITKLQQELKNGNDNSGRNGIRDSVVLFIFDPNTVSSDEFEKLGFSQKNAETLVKYRKSGGRFFKKEDFNKLFFVSDSLYEIYAPYIIIEKDEEKKEVIQYENKYQSKQVNAIRVEINAADTILLDSLPGIGMGYAKRIIKYRERLGGFYSTLQLLEVYDFSQEMYDKLKNNVYVNPALIRKINVNKAEFKELIKHPYLNKMKVIKILDFRKVMKHINNMDELVKNGIIEASDSEKLNSYFEFE